MDFGIAFALGLLGSLHCAAMCGPLMLALPVPPGGAGRFVAGRIIYQLGRVTTYCLLGVVAGLVGKSIFLAGLQRWLSIALGVAILLAFSFPKKLPLSAPVVRLVARLKAAMSAQLQQRSFRSLALLGMLNGLLPCGLVYVALAGAVARGTILARRCLHGRVRSGHAADDARHQSFGKIVSARRSGSNCAARFRSASACSPALLILRGMALGIPYVSPDLAAGTPACCAR